MASVDLAGAQRKHRFQQPGRLIGSFRVCDTCLFLLNPYRLMQTSVTDGSKRAAAAHLSATRKSFSDTDWGLLNVSIRFRRSDCAAAPSTCGVRIYPPRPSRPTPLSSICRHFPLTKETRRGRQRMGKTDPMAMRTVSACRLSAGS